MTRHTKKIKKMDILLETTFYEVTHIYMLQKKKQTVFMGYYINVYVKH